MREVTADGARAMVIKSDAALFSGGADVALFHGKTQQEGRDTWLPNGIDCQLEEPLLPNLTFVLCGRAGAGARGAHIFASDAAAPRSRQ